MYLLHHLREFYRCYKIVEQGCSQPYIRRLGTQTQLPRNRLHCVSKLPKNTYPRMDDNEDLQYGGTFVRVGSTDLVQSLVLLSSGSTVSRSTPEVFGRPESTLQQSTNIFARGRLSVIFLIDRLRLGLSVGCLNTGFILQRQTSVTQTFT